MSPVLECAVVIFIIVATVVLVLLSVNALKLLDELTKTAVSIREMSDLAKKELEPALKSVNGVLSAVNDVTNATNRNFALLKKIAATVIGFSVMAVSKTVNKENSFLSGLKSGFSIFRKKGDKNVSR